jgi:NTE family protein
MKIHAVFEGGGVKGIALAGAIQGAMQAGVTFDQVAGTSSGAIAAAFLAAGYCGDEMKQMIIETPFRSFLQRSAWFDTRLFGPMVRLWFKKGLYSGHALEQWVQDKLKAKHIRTFGDLPKNQLRIVASDITNGKLIVLPDDISQYGMKPESLSIARAVRMSASIPYFFDPVRLYALRTRSASRLPSHVIPTYIVDGGLLSNFPLWIFDQQHKSSNTPVIGFQLVGRNEFKSRHIRGPLSMMQALIETMLSAHDERYIEHENRLRTVKIPTLGVRSTQFEISKSTSIALYRSGQDAAERFFKLYFRSRVIS